MKRRVDVPRCLGSTANRALTNSNNTRPRTAADRKRRENEQTNGSGEARHLGNAAGAAEHVAEVIGHQIDIEESSGIALVFLDFRSFSTYDPKSQKQTKQQIPCKVTRNLQK